MTDGNDAFYIGYVVQFNRVVFLSIRDKPGGAPVSSASLLQALFESLEPLATVVPPV